MGDRPRFLWGIPLRGPLSHRLSVSFRTIMIMMVVPAIISVLMMIGFSQLYYSFLSRAERINDLNAVVVDTLTNELFNIVAGRGSFEDGPQEKLLRGVTSLISRESISIKNDLISALAGFKLYLKWPNEAGEWVKIKPVASIDLNTVVFILMIIIGAVILQKTRFGRNVYAIGGNEQSARLMGLPVARTKVLVYGFNGLCSVLAGVSYALYVKSGWNLALQGAELDVISCCVIGSVMLSGGVGYMQGTMLGVLLKATIPAIITFNGSMNSWWAKIFTGLLLLMFIVIQRAVVASSAKVRKT